MKTGTERRQSQLTIGFTNRTSSTFAAPVSIPVDDPTIRLLDGRYAYGTKYPYTKFKSGQAITAGSTATLRSSGLPANRYSLLTGMEFFLPADVSRFEFAHLNAGNAGRIHVEINGRPVNVGGFDGGRTTFANGAIIYSEVELPEATAVRRVRLWTAARPLGGILLESGSLAEQPARPNSVSVVYQGDSITEGTGATDAVRGWAIQSAYRLGIDDPIVVAVGGSGYLARHATATDAGYNFRERLEDVTRAVDNGPPDILVVAGGRNDCGSDDARFTPAQTGAEALAYFRAVRAAVPEMPIIVVGPFTDSRHPDYSDGLRACRDAIFQAAGQVSLTWTIDVADWVTPADVGTVFAPSTISQVHPVDAGHSLYALRFAQAVAAFADEIP